MMFAAARSLPGEEAPAGLAAGDFLLVHRGRWAGAAIRWGQGVRFRGDDRKYAYWNHAALVVGAQGQLVEALFRRGATRTHIDKYRGLDYVHVSTGVGTWDASQMLRFAERIAGAKYGLLDDASVALSYATGCKLSICTAGSVMCSELVARALERAGEFFLSPQTVAPADLAKRYGITKGAAA